MPPMRENGGRRAPNVLLEVCVETFEDAVAAADIGANRIELNAALTLDGLTPSVDQLRKTRQAVGIPVVTMARPRAGDFVYSTGDLHSLRREVSLMLENGADGVAFGLVTDSRSVDVRRCKPLVREIHDARKQAVFHRAFDVLPKPLDELEQLIDLGFDRVMTSGGESTAEAGSAMIASLRRRAAGRIEILPAGGIRPANVVRLLARTDCDQIHSSARDPSGRMSRKSLAELVRAIR